MAGSELVPFNLIAEFGRSRIKTEMRLAATSLLVYDYFLTLDSEVTLMWSSKLSLMKILYFYTRYSAFIDVPLVLYYQVKTDISAVDCKRIYLSASWLVVVGIIVAEVILMIRTWALWQRGKRMAVALVTLSIIAIVAAGVIEGLYLKTLTFASFPGNETPGCLLIGGNPTIGVNFILIIIVETVVLILTVTAGIQRFRFARSSQGLASVLHHDGVMFYVYLFTISLLNFIVILTVPAYGGDLLTGTQRVLHSCLSARVITNLRAAGLKTSGTSAFNSVPLVFAAPVESGDTQDTSDQQAEA